MKTLGLILIFSHGSFHILGFVKAFNLLPVNQLKGNISKVNGVLWLISFLLFVTAAFQIILKLDWFIFLFTGTILSQYLIFTSWQDAKFGTIANIILLIAILVGFGDGDFT